ncbi:hypothetical protein MLP_00230 [Microlunatus phosphovorus NM-1]|uniref:DUF2231 domain-containing protein n=1 Tax=Microlunatus phosphovorus (strain ATCC 700054 / DSM 10555 / JCM 9379 / NBRC 101784 / NCIMB 13414 / VKM Ac-1990 / NM-1) TaxID=1032480 RepID=F5XGD0_MICPN|nr:DUF2231 domain-containing protein [Microlunatus phosphovorus]BAK33037.1 hypothetical protein MLP_00230 [Microlunatus phosphovorus NM-1]
MYITVFGLPVHPLIVHATVVVVPVAALTVLLSVLWSRFRDWIGVGVLVLPALTLILVPLTTQSGEQLEHKLSHSALIERHAHLADSLLPWVIALLVGAAGAYLWRPGAPRITRGRVMPTWLRIVVLLVVVVAAAGTLVDVVLIGHSGAAAAWSDVG